MDRSPVGPFLPVFSTFAARSRDLYWILEQCLILSFQLSPQYSPSSRDLYTNFPKHSIQGLATSHRKLSLLMSLDLAPGMSLTDDRGPQVIKTLIACSVLSGLAVVGRIISRKLLKANLLVSDYLVVLGLLSAWLVSGLALWSKHNLELMLFWNMVLLLRGSAYPLQVFIWVWVNMFRWSRSAI